MSRSPVLSLGSSWGKTVILCVGGTPAVQRTLDFPNLLFGEVNRASAVRITASGKVVNAARVATVLGGQALVATFLGGDAGRFVVRELDAAGVAYRVPPPGAVVDEAGFLRCNVGLPGLALQISLDDGRTWVEDRPIALEPGQTAQVRVLSADRRRSSVVEQVTRDGSGA